MILSLSIYAILATIAFVCAVVAPHTRWGSKHQALGSGVKPSRRQLRARSDFEKAQDWLREQYGDPKEWEIADSVKQNIDKKLESQEEFTFKDVRVSSPENAVDAIFSKKKKTFRLAHFTLLERVELIEDYCDMFAKKIDDYADTKRFSSNAVERAEQKHRARIESKKSATKTIEGLSSSWDTEFSQVSQENKTIEERV